MKKGQAVDFPVIRRRIHRLMDPDVGVRQAAAKAMANLPQDWQTQIALRQKADQIAGKLKEEDSYEVPQFSGTFDSRPCPIPSARDVTAQDKKFLHPDRST